MPSKLICIVAFKVVYLVFDLFSASASERDSVCVKCRKPTGFDVESWDARVKAVSDAAIVYKKNPCLGKCT